MAKQNVRSTRKGRKSAKRSRQTKSRPKSALDTTTNRDVICIACKKKLATEGYLREDNTIPIVYDGLVARAPGNYGSAIFDPLAIRMRHEGKVDLFLQFVICDDCIREHAKEVEYMMVKKEQISTVEQRKTYAEYAQSLKDAKALFEKLKKTSPEYAHLISGRRSWR